MEEDEIGGACAMYGGGKKKINTWFVWGNPRKKSPQGRPIISGDTLITNSKEIRWNVMDWINLASIICSEFIAMTLLHY